MTRPAPRKPSLTSRTRAVRLPAGAFSYRVWEAAATDLPPAVLLHANAASAASWSRVAPALADCFQVHALDLRGHGHSVRPAAGTYGLREAADDVLALLQALGLARPLIIGHSWGAAIALVLAAGAETDRAAPALSALVLEDPPAAFSPFLSDPHLRTLLRAVELPAEVLRETIAAVNPMWHRTDIATLAQGLSQADPIIVRSVLDDGARSGPLLPLLGQVTTPVLLLRADPKCGGVLADEDWSRARELLPPGSSAINLPDTPHEIHRARLERFVSALRSFTAPQAARRQPAPREPGASHDNSVPDRHTRHPTDSDAR